MVNREINFKAAFGSEDRQVRLYYVSGMVHPRYHIEINNKLIGAVAYLKLTLGGRPELWRCEWDERYSSLFTSDDSQIMIEIASEHYEKFGSSL